VRDDIVRSAADLWQGFGGVAASGLRIVLILLAAWLVMSIAPGRWRVMRQVWVGLRADPAHAHRILDDLEVAGVERWADSSVILRARFRVAALEQWTVRREYLLRLKRAFDDHGIEIPFPQLTVRAAANEGGPGKRGPRWPSRP